MVISQTGHLPDWSSPDDPARVLAALGRLNPSLPNSWSSEFLNQCNSHKLHNSPIMLNLKQITSLVQFLWLILPSALSPIRCVPALSDVLYTWQGGFFSDFLLYPLLGKEKQFSDKYPWDWKIFSFQNELEPPLHPLALDSATVM